MPLDSKLFQLALVPLTVPTGSIEVPEYGAFGVRDVWANSGVTFQSGGYFGDGRAVFNGSSQLSRESNINIGSGQDFTIEVRFETSLLTQQYQTVVCADNYDGIYVNYNRIIYFLQGAMRCTINVDLQANTEYHVAVVRSGGEVSIYLNGVKGETTYSSTINTTVRYIGGKSIQFLSGKVTEFRVTQLALYEANFTPPTARITTDPATVFTRTLSVAKRGYAAGVQPNQRLKTPQAVRQRMISHYGQGLIYGTVKEAHVPSDIPLRRKVRLHDSNTGDLVRETWSSANGAYQFKNLELKPYYAISFDYTGVFNAVINDRIVPEV